MSRNDDLTYFSLRAAEELQRGDQAIDATVANIHYELAYQYGLLVSRMNTGTPKLTLVQNAKQQLAA